MGSTRPQLIAQFMSETLALTITATLLSIALIPFLLKAFSGYIPEAITFNRIFQPNIIAFIIALMLRGEPAGRALPFPGPVRF